MKVTNLAPCVVPRPSDGHIALWDIKGQAAGRPVYDLIGGRFRDRIALYCNSWFQSAGPTLAIAGGRWL